MANYKKCIICKKKADVLENKIAYCAEDYIKEIINVKYKTDRKGFKALRKYR
jgi:hypothetical protein